jgi:hypothetical protein
VFSNGIVTVESRYTHPAFVPNASAATTVTSSFVALPVAVASGSNSNTGIALIANSTATVTLILRDVFTTPGGFRTIDVTPGQQIAGFVKDLLPTVTSSDFRGLLTITTNAGTVSVLALQFDGAITPVIATTFP